MKKIVILFILSKLYSFSQIHNNDYKLIEALGVERYSYLMEKYPDSLEYYHFILTDGFDIMLKQHVDIEKLSGVTSITIPSDWLQNGIPQKSSIIVFKLPVKFASNHYQYYLIEGTEYVLKIKPLDYINRKFQAKPK